ncbi:reverse transcriptase domain-containing protein, partial [Tanacetum coccineum]
HPSETIVFHNEDGNPARANIKQALGYRKDGDGDGNSQPHKGVKASANSDVKYSFTSAQDGEPLQDDWCFIRWTSDSTAGGGKVSEVTKDTELPSTEDIQPPPLIHEQTKDKEPIEEPSFVANKAKPNLPYPSRLNKEKIREKDDILASKFMEIFRNLHFELSFADALIHMPKSSSTVNTRATLIRTASALLDVYEGEIIFLGNMMIIVNLYCGDCTFHFIQQTRIIEESTILIDATCDGVLTRKYLIFRFRCFLINPSRHFNPIVYYFISYTHPFDESDFLLFEEADAFIAIDDEPVSPVFNATYYDPEGDILILEALLNNDPLPSPDQGDYYPGIQKDLKVVEPKESSLEPKDEIPEVELKELPPHLEYAFLEENNKLPVIISKDLSQEEKTSLIHVLKNRKQAIAWKLSDIRGIDPEFCSHKILLEDDYQPSVQHQRRVNPKIHDVIKKEVEKLLDAGLIYPYFDYFNSLLLQIGEPTFEIHDAVASDYAIGAVLGQRIEKHFRPIHYASKTMTEAESNYTTTEKEMLAVVYAFEKFRSYLIMNKSVFTRTTRLEIPLPTRRRLSKIASMVFFFWNLDFKVIDTKGADKL